MSAAIQAEPPKGAFVARSIAGAVVALMTLLGGPVVGTVVLFALLGTPLFVIMGGSAELAWLFHKDPAYHHLRYIAATVMDERFADSPILVTIPLFTFVGYMLAEAKTPDRLVDAARSALCWLPGGLAIVAVIASAVFTVLTGGSGVTIIAIGGLLYPALRKQNYSDNFALGLVTTGGSVGLLLPYSLPLLVYSLVAHVDFNETFKAVLIPGALVILLLSLYSAYVGMRDGVARERQSMRQVMKAVWSLKWELGIPVILMTGLGTGLTSIDESAGLVALYTIVIEFFIYKDLSFKKDFVRIAKSAMALAGAIILILAMANALMNYVTSEKIPKAVLDFMLAIGITHKWQFLIVMNIFLLIIGMLMEGFSAILVAVPLILPFVAALGKGNPSEQMSPFQLAMVFLLNLELAYCLPPLGLNLFIASFRFNRPVASLYKVVLPFAAILAFGLMLVSYIPWISNAAVASDIVALKVKAAKEGVTPRDAWMMECVQEDTANPQPCSTEDRKAFPNGEMPHAAPTEAEHDEGSAKADEAGGSGECNPDFGDCDAKKKADDKAPAASAAEIAKKIADCNPDFDDCDALKKKLMAGASPAKAPTAAASPAKAPTAAELAKKLADCNPDFDDCDAIKKALKAAGGKP